MPTPIQEPLAGPILGTHELAPVHAQGAPRCINLNCR